ncbi:flagellar basal body P-ring formation chaperone FlgA [Selenomonas sp. F0473]|uniref:flagellar basal body P-ring formation chaperone FlgA n=1 Tax=Selenomonas sp. F0473 TaxID=999423 RepID=UPI001E285A29|nr:flagellar basal body P-ring formation chaperone FlgA [Selenomonas sp. F0473]
MPAPHASGAAYGWAGEQFPNVLSAAQIAQLASRKIEETLAERGETRRHELHLRRTTNTMRLPAGEITAEVTFPRELPYGRDFPALISVYVDGVFRQRATFYYQLTVYDRVLVAMTDIRTETAITPANARIEERAVDTAPPVTLTDFAKLEGRVAGRYIRKDTVITPQMLAMPLVIRAGNPVTLILDANGIAIRAEGVAMEGGRIGYTIRVRNARSGKMMRGKVIDAQTVRISG